MKTIKVVAAIIIKGDKFFATQRGYGAYKDWWEFPGGKVEAGETPEEALKREIREELDTEISVDEYLMTVEYDYPEFHVSMDCFICGIVKGHLTLLEHEAAKWLPLTDPLQVKWLPSDIEVVQRLTEWNI
jgi:8-oxo-dGTP diphosphatase